MMLLHLNSSTIRDFRALPKTIFAKRGYVNLKLLRIGPEYTLRHNKDSAAKAAYSLARFCPRLSMAPGLAIVEMVAALF